jgi:Pectate lyase superfamily protein
MGINSQGEQNMPTPKCVDNYNQLRSVTPSGSTSLHPPICDYTFVAGLPDPQNSGLQGFFEWRSNSAEDDNGGTVIKPNAISAQSKGRWHREFEGSISVRWFGAKGDGDTDANADDTEAIQLAIGAATVAGGGIVFFSAGTYVSRPTSTSGTHRSGQLRMIKTVGHKKKSFI